MGSLGEALMPQTSSWNADAMARPPGLGAPGSGRVVVVGLAILVEVRRTNSNLKLKLEQPQQPQDMRKMLQGIKTPQGPDVVKPSTPAARR